MQPVEALHIAPDLSERSSTRLSLDDLAPDDPFRELRWGLLALFGVVFAWSFEVNGLPIARLAVLGWVAAAFVLGNVGRPLHQQQRMVTDLVLYAIMWLAYDYSRGIADTFGMPLQVEAPRNIDKVLFFGTDPNHWMQVNFYSSSHIRWYDVAGSLVYFSHFFLPVAASVYLWITWRPDWIRYIRRFATVLFAGVATYVLLPTAPPWMAASPEYPYQIMAPLNRPTGRGWQSLGLESVSAVLIKGQEWSNATAAMPSLHAAFALFTVAFFWRRARSRVLRGLMALFPISMALTLVYFGEHYVTDVLAGWLYVAASFAFWGWWESRRRSRRTAEAFRALGVPEPAQRRRSALLPPGRNPQVVIDSTAIVAALDPDDPHHLAMTNALTGLVAEYQEDELRLVTHSDSLTAAVDELTRRGLGSTAIEDVDAIGGVCDVSPLHADLREDAREVVESAGVFGVDLELRTALTVEMARRSRTRRVLSTDPGLELVDLDNGVGV